MPCASGQTDGGGCMACIEPSLDCNGDAADGCEVDPRYDPQHCGRCERSCPGEADRTETCQDGRCARCTPGFRDCNHQGHDGCEVDLDTDVKNCGGCGQACPAPRNGEMRCEHGVCMIARCNVQFADCNGLLTDGCETNTAADPRNCGDCGQLCPGVQSGKADCVSGSCVLSACDPPMHSCRLGSVHSCETNVNADPKNCGFCTNVCGGVAHGTSGCTGGVCGIGSCDADYRDCRNGLSDGCETNIKTDPNNCGFCGNVCPTPANGYAVCTSGVCGLGACVGAFRDCNGNPIDGCEVNTALDTGNCGACGNGCPAPAHATAGCALGLCGIGRCAPGYEDCNGSAADGCETDIYQDPSNCGSCRTACAAALHSKPACQAGQCRPTCASGWLDCNGLYTDGCEIDAADDARNCGGCGVVCPTPPFAWPGCSQGSCGIGLCLPPHADCRNGATDGCETDLDNDPDSCGVCDLKCSAHHHGLPACRAGMCTIGRCDSGYADCDSNLINGCETNLTIDVNNCGACGRICPSFPHSTSVCTGMSCGIGSCETGFADCNKVLLDGCETDLRIAPEHCGSCTNACSKHHSTPKCEAKQCQIASCEAGFADCNSSADDGCETDLKNTVDSCGKCGNRCSERSCTSTCASGKCAISACFPGFADCNKSADDGCEITLATDNNNCGACGNLCTSGKICASGSCLDAPDMGSPDM